MELQNDINTYIQARNRVSSTFTQHKRNFNRTKKCEYVVNNILATNESNTTYKVKYPHEKSSVKVITDLLMVVVLCLV